MVFNSLTYLLVSACRAVAGRDGGRRRRQRWTQPREAVFEKGAEEGLSLPSRGLCPAQVDRCQLPTGSCVHGSGARRVGKKCKQVKLVSGVPRASRRSREGSVPLMGVSSGVLTTVSECCAGGSGLAAGCSGGRSDWWCTRAIEASGCGGFSSRRRRFFAMCLRLEAVIVSLAVVKEKRKLQDRAVDAAQSSEGHLPQSKA